MFSDLWRRCAGSISLMVRLVKGAELSTGSANKALAFTEVNAHAVLANLSIKDGLLCVMAQIMEQPQLLVF